MMAFLTDAEYSKSDMQRDHFKEACNDLDSEIVESVQCMNEGLIANWNSRIMPDDNVYHDGDFMMGSSRAWESILNRLNGNIHLIKGNHDYKFVKQSYVKVRVEWIREDYLLTVKDPEASNGRSQRIILHHFAKHVWEDSHKGTWNLFGHSHGSLDNWCKDRLSIDIGVDSEHTNYFPISYEEIKKIMSKKSIKVVDHHDTNTGEIG